jgi:DNA primase
VQHPELLKVIEIYRQLIQEGVEPDTKQLMYHEDPDISRMVVSLQDIRHNISINWKKEPFSVVVPTREELYREELHSVLIYLKLRKIKNLIEENQREIAELNNPDELEHLLRTHQHLKMIERQLTGEMGTVIYR